jgi:hypothetical protein
MSDPLTETLWLDRRGVVVTPQLLAEALGVLEHRYGIGRALDAEDMANALVTLIHARQAADGRDGFGTVHVEIRPHVATRARSDR